jgi:vesicle-fusing ATPase
MDLGLSEAFDSEMHVPPISSLHTLEHIVQEVALFPLEQDQRRVIRMLEDAGFGSDRHGLSPRLQIGMNKLLSIIKMA